MGRRLRDSIAIAFVSAIVAFSWAASLAQAQANRLQVELDAFSGRPNPTWELTGARAEEFLTRLRALQPAPTGKFGGEILGYRGFIVRATTDGSLDGYDEVRLYRGTVFARQGDVTRALSDPERILERQLLDSARGQVPEQVLQYIADEVAR